MAIAFPNSYKNGLDLLLMQMIEAGKVLIDTTRYFDRGYEAPIFIIESNGDGMLDFLKSNDIVTNQKKIYAL